MNSGDRWVGDTNSPNAAGIKEPRNGQAKKGAPAKGREALHSLVARYYLFPGSIAGSANDSSPRDLNQARPGDQSVPISPRLHERVSPAYS